MLRQVVACRVLREKDNCRVPRTPYLLFSTNGDLKRLVYPIWRQGQLQTSTQKNNISLLYEGCFLVVSGERRTTVGRHYNPSVKKVKKGQCEEIFCFRFFSGITFPQAPENYMRVTSKIFKNLQSQVKVHHW